MTKLTSVDAAIAQGIPGTPRISSDAQEDAMLEERSRQVRQEFNEGIDPQQKHYLPDASPSPSPPPPLSSSVQLEEKATPPMAKPRRPLPHFLAWVPPKLNWRGIRPVVRSALSLWCGLLLLLGSKSGLVLGQASFLVLIVGVLSPASLPMTSAVEAAIVQFVMVTVSWAYSCLVLLVASASRTSYHFNTAEAFDAYATVPYAGSLLSAAEITKAISLSIYHGGYLEASSSVVCAVGLGFGCGACVFIRGYAGPGPVAFGVFFSIIMIVIVMTIGCLFPYPFYGLGLVFFIPYICQTAITLTISFLVFPESLAHAFAENLLSTIAPLQVIIRQQQAMLESNPRDETEWSRFFTMKSGLSGCMVKLGVTGTQESNLTRELSYARVSGKDLKVVHRKLRVLVSKTTGFVYFHQVVAAHLNQRNYSEERDKEDRSAADLVVHMRSRPASVMHSPPVTRPSSLRNETPHSPDPSHLAVPTPVSHLASPLFIKKHQAAQSEPSVTFDSPLHSDVDVAAETGSATPPDEDHPPKRGKGLLGSHLHHLSQKSLPLFHELLHPHREVRPIGLVESERYMDLEDYLHNPRDEAHIAEIVRLLAHASADLITILDHAVAHLVGTIHRFKSRPLSLARFGNRNDDTEYDEAIRRSAEVVREVEQAIQHYRTIKRLDVINPFASIFDPATPQSDILSAPSHRGLYWAFSYQSSLLGWSDALLDLLQVTCKVEQKRKTARFWFPEWTKFKWGLHYYDNYENEAPESIPGLNAGLFTAGRNPDARAPTTLLQTLGLGFHNATKWTRRGDVLFGLKTSLLLPLVALPAFFPSTAYFFYSERGIWVVIMAALTSSQFVGDTAYGFVARILGTALGAVIGMALWYIGSGSGPGNAYGVAVVCFVVFPLLMFHRLHYMPPIAAILTSVTAALVVGYSWQDTHSPALSAAGYGFEAAWKRFVCVTIGISAAFLFAYLPPTITQKETVRRTYAKVIAEMGGTLCQIISFSNLRDDHPVVPPQLILQNIAALRTKVAKTSAARLFIRYEVSLQGAWPAKEYDALQNIQMELLDLIGQFLGVVCSLDKKWTRALLRRAQLSNPRFLGEMLSSFQLISSSLKHSTPLPWMSNPLLERFLKPTAVVMAQHSYGYDISLDKDQEIPGIPLHVNLSTICSMEYLQFSTGISLAYAICNRIDRMMLISKTLLGESYIIYGLEDERHASAPPEGLEHKWHGFADDSRNASRDTLV